MRPVLFSLYLLSLTVAGLAQTPYQPGPYSAGASVNYIRTWTPQRPLTDPATVVANTNIAEVGQSTQYFDGLGRPLQTVDKQASPAKKDIVTPHVYDAFGREAWQFLPYASASATDGAFKLDPFAEQKTFYTTQLAGQGQTYYYSQTNFEPSPLSRPLLSMPAGNNWVGSARGTELSYEINGANEVRVWTVPATNGNVPTSSSFYAAGKLYRQVTQDEDGNRVVDYKDLQGRVVLKKVESDKAANAAVNTHTGWLCTYYIYDDLGQLRWVIQPVGVQLLSAASWAFDNTNLTTSTIAKEQCFYYEYDYRMRLVVKKVPGAATEEMVYDVRDRLVMKRDGNLTAQGYWLINKYDALNRLTQNYLALNNFTRARNQDSCTNNSNYPTVSSSDLMQENYYDTYAWVNTQPGIGATLYTGDIWSAYFITSYNTAPDYAQPVTADYTRARGKLTGVKVRVFGTSTYLYSVHFYDSESRLIQTRSGNLSGGTGGYNIITTQYDFSGKVLRRLHRSSKSTPVPKFTVELTKYSYDHAGRLRTIAKKISSAGTDKIISDNVYDELGRLKRKTLGGGLESQDYEYNVRGWLLGVNRKYVKGDSTNAFGYELGYDNTQTILSGGTYTNRQYNGNIGGWIWKSAGDGQARKYDFAYDAANRLTKADFNQYTSGSFNKTAGMDFSVSSLGYDGNGNIAKMTQKGWKANASAIIDSLVYTYTTNSNRLAKVKDNANDVNSKLGDFKDGTNTDDDYSYDVNGNLTKDKNKGITTILYTHLNTPYEIRIAGKGKITYTYDNLGNKLKRVVTDSTVSPVKTTTWQYIQNYTYKNDTLESFTHEEGRARYDTTETQGEATKYQYDYFVKDHLGNVRMVLTSQKDTAFYPALSFEGAAGSAEQQTQDAIWENRTGSSINIASVRTIRPGAFGTAGSNGSYALLVKKSTGAIGAAKLLKVMAGDRIHTAVDYFYTATNASNGSANGLASLVANIATAITGSSQVGGALKDASSSITTTMSGNTALGSLLNTPNNTSGSNQAPKAYLNIIFFDDQFHFDAGSSVVIPVPYSPNTKGTLSRLAATAVKAGKSGYVYVYCSNETEEMVYFDNFTLTHELSSLREETHYYPFGLTMAGISSKALKNDYPNNKYKFNGIEQSNEFDINMYDAFYRNLDPQIGRFWQIDPKPGDAESLYSAMANNPILNSDFLGDTTSPAVQRFLEQQRARNKDGDQKGFITNAPADYYESHPIKAFLKDVGHAGLELMGMNAVDDYIANRIDGQNSPGQILTETVSLGLSTTAGEKVKGEPIEIVINGNSHPEAAAHAQEALNNGVSGEGVIDRGGAKARRAENLRNVERRSGQDRDEFPPAVINNGGNGNSVRHISPFDNRGAGASLGAQIRNLPDNTRVVIRIIPDEIKKKK